jgi:anti-anti-sigma regulatory factor
MWTGPSRNTTVTLERIAGRSVVSVTGALDYAAVQPCRAALDAATDVRAPIVFDLARVVPPGAVSVALLGAMRRYVGVRGAVMTLTGVPRPWRSALEQANVWCLYECARDRETAGGGALAVGPVRTLDGRPGESGPDPSRGPPDPRSGPGDAGGDGAR